MSSAVDANAGFQPLRDIRVLDITSVLMGPLATQVLADQGADVITVESRSGDPNRSMGRGPHPELSGVALNLMRNKRSIALDFRHPEGAGVLRRLIGWADVLVTNLRPGSRRRSGIAPADVLAINPAIVYCAASGFDGTSDRADEPAYDDVIQAQTGVVDLTARRDGTPQLLPTVVADKVCGLVIANAVLSGLFERSRANRGVVLELSMYDIMRGFVLVEHGAEAIPEPALGEAGYRRVLSAGRSPLATSDGTVVVLAYERHHFESLARIGGRTDLLNDARFESHLGRLDNIDELYTAYGSIARAFTTEQFVDLCRGAGVPVSAVATIDDVVRSLPIHSHPVGGEYRVTPSLAPGCPTDAQPRRAAPLVGEHSVEILSEIGYAADEISALVDAGAVTARASPGGE